MFKFLPAKPALKNTLFLILISFFLFLMYTPKAYAATFTVNSTTDAVDASPGNSSCATAGSVCTLRAAIQEANALAGTDTITLPAGTYTLTITGTGEDASATGDLDITSDMTINGADESSTIIDAATIDRVLEVRNNSTITISNLTVKNGNTTSSGGGIKNTIGSTLVLNQATVSNNSGGNGGGVDNDGPVTLTGVTIRNNTTSGTGGGIDSFGHVTISDSTIDSNTSVNDGGGIWANGITATNVTFSNNTTTGGWGGGLNVANDPSVLTNLTFNGNTALNGGGILEDGGGTTTFSNITITNNTATVQGGGIDVHSGTPSLTNMTIANNTAPAGTGAGIYVLSGRTATFLNTILSSNTTENCAGTGTFTSSGYNLSSDSSCSASFNQAGDLNSTDPMLSALADNGGTVQTMALQSGSPAIDGGTNTGCPATDARGTSRPQDGDNNGTSTCDIGAYEYVYVAGTTPTSVSSDEDKCPQVGDRWIGVQSEVPSGVAINDKGQCYDLPISTANPIPLTLPNTGNYNFTLILVVLATFLISSGLIISKF